MCRRWNGKEIRVGLVTESPVEVESVAGKDQLRVQSGGASNLVGVTLCLSTVEDWWVQNVGNVADDFWHTLECWQCSEQL